MPGGDVWLEAGSVTLGPLFLDAALSSDVLHSDAHLLQHTFLSRHDSKHRRLWFLWSTDTGEWCHDPLTHCS